MTWVMSLWFRSTSSRVRWPRSADIMLWLCLRFFSAISSLRLSNPSHRLLIAVNARYALSCLPCLIDNTSRSSCCLEIDVVNSSQASCSSLTRVSVRLYVTCYVRLYVMLCYVMLYIMLYVMLCYVMLCVMLCYMLYVVLGYMLHVM